MGEEDIYELEDEQLFYNEPLVRKWGMFFWFGTFMFIFTAVMTEFFTANIKTKDDVFYICFFIPLFCYGFIYRYLEQLHYFGLSTHYLTIYWHYVTRYRKEFELNEIEEVVIDKFVFERLGTRGIKITLKNKKEYVFHADSLMLHDWSDFLRALKEKGINVKNKLSDIAE